MISCCLAFLHSCCIRSFLSCIAPELMYKQESACSGANPVPEDAIHGFSENAHVGYEESFKLSTEELAYRKDASRVVEYEQQQVGMVDQNGYSNGNGGYVMPFEQVNRESAAGSGHGSMQVDHLELQNGQQHQVEVGYSHQFNPPDEGNPYPTADLLNLFQMPRCSSSSLVQSSIISFGNPSEKHLNCAGYDNQLPENNASASSVFGDPLFHLKLNQQPPLFRELFRGYNFQESRYGSLFGGFDEREVSGGVYQDADGGQFESEILEFSGKMVRKGKGKAKEGNAEKQRREQFNDKYQALKALVPKSSKADRASIVADAIEYIKELNRTVSELKLLVEKKRCGRERTKRLKTEEEALGDYNGSLRSSWLQRKAKDAEVDVRIVDDEVTIKLVQRKKVNCLLLVSKMLDELQLDLQHVAGGHVGDFYSFLFNTKIDEGSSIYASAIANRLLEIVERQYAATSPATASR